MDLLNKDKKTSDGEEDPEVNILTLSLSRFYFVISFISLVFAYLLFFFFPTQLGQMKKSEHGVKQTDGEDDEVSRPLLFYRIEFLL